MDKEYYNFLKYLYNSKENSILCIENYKWINKNFWDKIDIENILKTPSINKWYIIYDFPSIKLTQKGIDFIEYLEKPFYKKIIIHLQTWDKPYAFLFSILALIISIISLILKI